MKKISSFLKKKKKQILIADAAIVLVMAGFFLMIKEPAKVEGLQIQGSTFSTANITWDKNEDANAYRIYRSEEGGDYEYIGTTTENAFNDENLTTGKKYSYAVTAKNGIKTGDINEDSKAEVTPSLDKPELKIDVSKGEVALDITPVDGAAGYEIIRDGKVIAESESCKFVDESASSDKSYKYEVKAFRYKDEHVYSDVSNKVKTQMHGINNLVMEANKDEVLFDWEPSDHYRTYEIYNGEEKVAESEDTEFRLSDYEIDTTYKIKIIGVSEDGKVRSPEDEQRFQVAEEPMDNEGARQAAADWAVEIAHDDSFTYGTGSRCHSVGCHFCGTNSGARMAKKGTSLVNGHSYDKTYVCNSFVHAAYAHGAGDQPIYNACYNASSCLAFDQKSFTRYGNWSNVGKPAGGNLMVGDVLVCKRHLMIYCGNGIIAHAKSEGWGPGSIDTDNLSSYYGMTKFVMRYTGNGSGTMYKIKQVDVHGKVIEEDEETDENVQA